MGTAIVVDATPCAIVAVPDAGVKSAPAVAEPALVAQFTVSGALRPPLRVIVNTALPAASETVEVGAAKASSLGQAHSMLMAPGDTLPSSCCVYETVLIVARSPLTSG